ncbi:MAG TPA: hypothetical protein DCF68_03150 [Cyanothece sp. UBA12306]|nr:hypothetical protein [Cyanothece sp. UBA12306]
MTRDCLAVLISETLLIELDSDNLKQGKLEGWNLKGLTMSTENQSQTIPIEKIKKVDFTGDILLPRGNNYLRISEEKRIIDNQKIWEYIPLTRLSLADGGKIALLQLRGILGEKDWQDLVNQSQYFIYVIDQIEFNQEANKMTIKASPIPRNL